MLLARIAMALLVVIVTTIILDIPFEFLKDYVDRRYLDAMLRFEARVNTVLIILGVPAVILSIFLLIVATP